MKGYPMTGIKNVEHGVETWLKDKAKEVWQFLKPIEEGLMGKVVQDVELDFMEAAKLIQAAFINGAEHWDIVMAGVPAILAEGEKQAMALTGFEAIGIASGIAAKISVSI